jgi:preprotein translocase subunit YajC
VIPLIFLAAMIILFWVLIVMPQRRRRSIQYQLLMQLEPGDEVMTVGGLFGTVREVGDHHVELEIAPGTQVRLAKSAITARTDAEREEEPSDGTDGSTEASEAPLP